MAGPVAPWFGQPGQGTQYQTPYQVKYLLEDHFIEELDLTKSEVAMEFERAIEAQRVLRSTLELEA